MSLLNKVCSANEVEAKKEKKRLSIFTIIIILILIIIIAIVCIITFDTQQNKISSNNFNSDNNVNESIIGRKAIITEFSGDVIINRNKIDIKAFNDFRLEEGDIIKTGSDSFAKIDIDGNKVMKMDNNSIIQITSMSGDKLDNVTTIILSNGRIMNYINEKLNENSRYEIKTLNTIIGVKGTIFAVTCQSNESNNFFTKVENLSGLVEVAKVNIQNSNEILEKIIVNINQYTVVEERINNEEKLQLNEIDKNNLDEFIKTDLNEILIERNKEQNTETNTETNTSSTPNTSSKPNTSSTPNTSGTPNTSSKPNTSGTTSTTEIPRTSDTISISDTPSTTEIIDTEKPVLFVSRPSSSLVKVGETIKFVVEYSDNVSIREISLKPEYIVLNGFRASIGITGTGNSRTITLSNIDGDIGENKYIEIIRGTATDSNGNFSDGGRSTTFTLEPAIRPSTTDETGIR